MLDGESRKMSISRQVASGAKPFQKVKDDRSVASSRLQDEHLRLGKPGTDLATGG
jgi:hypothetical protein